MYIFTLYILLCLYTFVLLFDFNIFLRFFLNDVAIPPYLSFGFQLRTIICDSLKLFKVDDKLYLEIRGLQTDALSLFQKVKCRCVTCMHAFIIFK